MADEVKMVACANVDCPYDGRAAVVELFGNVFPMMCERCVADEDALDGVEEANRLRDVALSRLRPLHPGMADWTLASYPRDGSPVLQAAQRWLEGQREGRVENLVLTGPVGSGKTGLAWALLRELAEGGEAGRIVNWRDVLDHLRQSFDDKRLRPNLDDMRRVRRLCIDDLGAERPTDWAVEQLAGMVDARYKRLSTIVTTNYRPGELAKRLGDGDDVIGARIVSRLMDGAVVIEVRAADRRVA